MSFAEEQDLIIETQSRMAHGLKGRGWNKYRGHVTESRVAALLGKHLPEGLKLVSRWFVKGCSHEFDIIIIKEEKPIFEVKNTLPRIPPYPYACPKERVKLMVEVKASGLKCSNAVFKEKLAGPFQKIRREIGRSYLYFTVWESRPRALMTREVLGKSAFILREGGGKNLKAEQVVQGEWERFVKQILNLSRKELARVRRPRG